MSCDELCLPALYDCPLDGRRRTRVEVLEDDALARRAHIGDLRDFWPISEVRERLRQAEHGQRGTLVGERPRALLERGEIEQQSGNRCVDILLCARTPRCVARRIGLSTRVRTRAGFCSRAAI